MAGFSFDLRTEYAEAPESRRVVERVLLLNGVPPAPCIDRVLAKILEINSAGRLPRDFRKWCDSEDAPPRIFNLANEWGELLFLTVALGTYAHHRREQMRSSSREIFPFWQLDSPTVYCSGHRKLDRLTARPDDPIWESVYPPNGWVCGCGVVPLLEEDVRGDAVSPSDISPALRQECASWLDRDPSARLLKII